MRSRFAVPALASLLLACSTETASSFKKSDGGTTNDAGFEEVVDSGLEIPQGDGGTIASNTPIGTATGTVYVPSGDLSMPGALVYLTATEPADIPAGNFCDKCVDVTSIPANGLSKTNGSFSVPVFAAGPHYLVVQKGAFRRVTKVTLKAGDNPFPTSATTLPGTLNRAAGEIVPRILVVDSDGVDPVTDALSRLGIDVPSADVKQPSDAEVLFRNATNLGKYQVIFLPCSAFGVTCGPSQALDATIKRNLKTFVQNGGKIYAADFSYEFVKQIWPGYIDWPDYGSSWVRNDIGQSCGDSYDARPTWVDQGLGDWMRFVGNASVTLGGNWSKMNGVKTVQGRDVNGNATPVTPKVWVKAARDGSTYPATVSFPDTCGRVMFSTFHAEGGAAHLAQEQALLYVLLEVNTCAGGVVDK